jgi:hypothetical protein
MPFTNREVAVIVANQLNRHDRGLWFYGVERHIDEKRWIIARNARVPLTTVGRSPAQSWKDRLVRGVTRRFVQNSTLTRCSRGDCLRDAF